MPMYKWNVRTVRISHDYIEEIVEARTAEEAQEKVDPTGYWDSDDGWQVDDNPELFINEDYTERMDKLFPDDYANPDDMDMEQYTLTVDKFDHGFLYGRGEARVMKLQDRADSELFEEDWIIVKAPSGEWYEINSWCDDETDEVHCTAYARKHPDVHRIDNFQFDHCKWLRLF